MNDEVLKAFKKLVECVKEYKKLQNTTYDDVDCAHFFNKNLKKWIIDNINIINVLSSVNFEKSFMTFVKHYLLVKDDESE